MSIVKTAEDLKKVLANRKKQAKERDQKKKEKKQPTYTKRQALSELIDEGFIGGTVYDIYPLIVEKGVAHNKDWSIDSIPHMNTLLRQFVEKERLLEVDKSLKKHYFYRKGLNK